MSTFLQHEEKYILDFSDDFNSKKLNTKKWLPFYLPQWSSRKKSKPNYKLKDSCLVLQITEDQQPWCPEFNGEVKCSSIQTGVFAGKLGSSIGQHKFNSACVVREEQKNRFTYLPKYGYFEIRMKALAVPSVVVALWMIGYEDKPHRNAEICIVEIKGSSIKKKKSVIGYGIHKFNDPKLKEAFFEEEFAIDAKQFHVYAAEWTKEKVSFFIDGKLIRQIKQAPMYPMQLMLGIYELPVKQKAKDDKLYPKEFVVDYVRGHRKK
jgi:hypothetical protein